MKSIHLAHVLYIAGLGTIVISLSFLLCIPVSIVYGDHQSTIFLISFLITLMFGLILYLFTRKNSEGELNKKDSFIIVTIAWLTVSVFGALPYFISGFIPSFTDAFFESTSGFTTTGSSILNDIEALPKSLLFWRALTHWLGGMGIIMLMIAIFPFLKVGANHLMTAEGSLFSSDKIKPRMIAVSKRLWLIYILLTFVETISLRLAGMNWYNAICHSFATIATGGFSTQNASLIQDSAIVQNIVIVFMFLSGVNFALHYYGFKGKIIEVWKNEELRLYTFLVFFISTCISINLILTSDSDFLTSIRASFFQVVSIITCTGFASANYETWPVFSKFLLLITMLFGACIGSTGGGIKIARYILMIKSLNIAFKRIQFPNSVFTVKFNGKTIAEPFILNTFSFVVIYILTILIGTVILTSSGMDLNTAGSSVITTLGGIGPGFGLVGPTENFSGVPEIAKIYLVFNMILGRLEILPFLYIFYLPFSKYV